MTEFDLVIDHFAREIDNLPRVSQSIFFASAARIIYDDHSDAIDELSLASVFEHAYKTITDAATDEGSRTSPFQGQVADALNAINSCSPDKPRFGEFVDLPGHGRTYSKSIPRTVPDCRSNSLSSLLPAWPLWRSSACGNLVPATRKRDRLRRS